MIKYGQSVVWTTWRGGKREIWIEGCNSLEYARQIVFKQARDAGWTPPRWWQWWRWRDRPRKDLSVEKDGR